MIAEHVWPNTYPIFFMDALATRLGSYFAFLSLIFLTTVLDYAYEFQILHSKSPKRLLNKPLTPSYPTSKHRISMAANITFDDNY